MRHGQSVAGDFNFPGWNLENNIVKTGYQFLNLHNMFGGMVNDQILQQLITDTISKENVLDHVEP